MAFENIFLPALFESTTLETMLADVMRVANAGINDKDTRDYAQRIAEDIVNELTARCWGEYAQA